MEGVWLLAVAVLVGSCWSPLLVNAQQGIDITLNDVSYLDDRLVNLSDIGKGESALLCTTTYSPCCSSANGGTQWYFPNGSQVMNDKNLPYHRTRSTDPRAVRLNLNSEGNVTGIFSCTILDASGSLQTLYVGIYFPPSAPTITSAVSLSPTSINLNWTQSTEDVVISYEVTLSYQGPCCGFTHTNTITVENTTMQYSLSGLQEFSNYTVSVTAVGAGNASATDVVTTLSSAPSGAPQTVSINITTSNTISIEWDRVDCTDRNSEISGYTVRYRPVGGTAMNSSVSGSDNLSYTATGLAHSTNYSFEVAAESSNGVGPFSVPTTAQTTSAPSAPIIEAVSLSPTSINLNWTQPTEDVVISYEITFSYQGPCNGFTHTNTTTVDGSSSTHALSGLQEFSNYAISVTAVNDVGNTTATEMVTTLSAAPSGTPQTVRINITTSTNISVEWDRVDCTDRNSEISGYIVRYGPVDDTAMNTSVSGSDSLSYTATGLTHSTNYSFEVAAQSSNGVGPFSDPITAQTPPTAPIIETVSESPTSINLSWTQSTEDVVISYEITFSYQGPCSGFTHTNTTTVDGSSSTHTLSGLQEFSNYTVSVTAMNDAGSTTTTEMVTTLSAAPSGAPQTVRTNTSTFTTISIEWDRVDCTDRNSEISGYIVRYRTVGGTAMNTSVSGSDSLSYTATGLMHSTNYSFEVAAESSNGVGPFSVPTTAQTTSAPSSPIIEAGFPSPTSINLNWTQSTEDVVISYEIMFSYQGPCSGFTHTNSITVDGSSSTHTLSGLQEYSNYTISVTAVNNVGNTTTTEMVTTSSAVPSGAPQAVWVLVTSRNTIHVQWDRVSCIRRNSEITGYTVRYAPSNGVGTNMVSGTARSERAYLISGLTVSTQYNIMIAANSIGGTGPFSNPITVWTPDVGLTLVNVNYANNSVVTIMDISKNAEALHCTTALPGCCYSGNGGGWFFPNGGNLTNNVNLPYYRTRAQDPGALLLHRTMGTTTGIFRCDIPDANSVMQSLYVGIYTTTTGNLEVTSLQFQLTTDLNATIPNFTITCTSTGGPVTTFSWRRDGALVTNNNSYSIAPQRVTDPVSGTYSHILTVTGRRAGQYECSVANNRPSMDTGNLTIETADPPTGLIVETVDSTSVRVSWTAPVTVATVTGYQIYYQAEEDWGSVFISAGVTRHTLDNLKDGLTYNITMVALSMHLPSSVVGPQTVTLEVSPLTVEVTGPNTTIAGQTISLTCTVSLGPNISVTPDVPDVQWLGPDGVNLLLNGSDGIMVDNTTMVSNSEFNRTLWFTPVQTSHRGQYTCQAVADSVNRREAFSLSVQIAAPTVLISVGTPTYSGTNTTLNCNITLSAAVDTVVDASWVNVAWTGPHGPISSNSSVAISDVTGSNNMYESTLTFSPLMSTATGNYMCEAVINPVNEQFLLMSSAGSGNEAITVQDLPPPEIYISTTGTPTAGEMFALTCSVTVVENVYAPPAVEWQYSNGSLITSGGNIQLEGPLIFGRISNLTLRFNRSRTSHGGQYKCQASITIPLAAISNHSNDSAVNVTIQVPPPQITITGSPTNDSFVAGVLLDLTCSIQLDPAVDTQVSVTGMWNRSGTPLSNASRITVFGTSESTSTQLLYQTRVQFNPLSGTDGGLFACKAVVEPQTPHTTFVLGTSAVYMRQINVTGEPPVPTVNITGDGDRVAGNNYVLTCKVTEELTADAVITWLNSTGDPVNLRGVTVGEVTQRGNATIQTLTFNSLRTSHGGEYICTAVISFFPQLIPDSSSNNSFAFSVLIPQPTVSVSLNRTGILYAGTSLTLTCSIQLSDSVDTNVNVSRMWGGPTGKEVTNNTYRTVSDLASGTTLMYLTTIEFSPLSTTDSGRYTCQALVTPDPESAFVIMSIKERDTPDIRVKDLPSPQVKIRTGGTSTAGEMYILTCSTTVVVENLVVKPSMEWRQYSNGSAIVGGNGISIGNPVTSGKTTNLTLTFDPLRTSHGGKYICSATVTAKGITLSSNESVADVTVQISAPTVSISAVQPQPYNGTNFSLSCTITLDPTVDTTVNVTGTWLKSDFEITTNETTCITVSDTLQVMTNPSTYLTMLQFEPLGSSSTDGGSYICNATVVPYPDAQFVTTTSRRDTHQLDVQALPLPVVSFKASSDEVVRDQRYTLTCTVQVVRFLANQPNVSWLNAGSSPLVGNGITVGQPMSNDNTTTLHFTIDQLGQSHEGRYTCQACISIDKVAIQGHCNYVTAQITLEVPSSVQNLRTVRVSDNSVNITWREPVTTNGIVNYTIEVREYTASTGRDLLLVPLSPEVKRSIPVSMLTAVDGEFTHTIAAQGLSAFIPFSASVTAVNLAGPGEPTDAVFFTREGGSTAPRNVAAIRLNGTAINASWVPLNLVEARGFIRFYVIIYEPATGGRQRKRQQQQVQVNASASYAIVGGLQPGVPYDVSVFGQTVEPGQSSLAVRVSPEPTPVPPPEPTPGGSGAVVAGVIVALVVALLIIVVVVVVAYFLYRSRRKGEASIKAPQYEMKPKPRTSSVRPLMSSMKRAEKEAETAVEKPPPVPSTEAMNRMIPISITSFRDHVQKMHSERDRQFEAEYQSLGSEPIAAHDVAKLPYNRPKNRFANIFPYDFSRVTLNSISEEEGSDYINACFMQGYNRENAYIAAQGPMPNTTSDFWRMIWEKRLPNIVILTKCIEAGRHKCEQYWGDNIGDDFETPDKKLTVTTTSVMPLADFDIRTFTVKSNENPDAEPLTVTQYHFTSWPDHGVPKFATSLIAFIRRVQRGHKKDDGYPLLVHCSAGVGRTGTFILLDSMLERIKVEDTVNVYEFLHNLRDRRVLMVQTLAQYVFIHDALDELITCGETGISAAGLRAKLNNLKTISDSGITGFARQFQLLDQVSRKPDEDDFGDAQEYYNKPKNRYPDKLPYNMSRARLRPTGEDGSEYINASFVDGYKRRNAYIATQAPLQTTISDFWRMIWEFKSKSIVMVCNMVEDNQETCYPYWPSKEGETVKYGKMVVTMQSKAAYGDFNVRKFNIQEDKGQGSQVEGFQVTQFHHTEWPEHGNPPSAAGLIELIDMLMKSQMSTGNRAITVMCNDGVGRTGTFICIHSQLERLKTEGVVDIFQSVKSIRIQRAGLVPEEEQFVYCHEVLADYIDKFDNYANFKDMI